MTDLYIKCKNCEKTAVGHVMNGGMNVYCPECGHSENFLDQDSFIDRIRLSQQDKKYKTINTEN